MFPFSETLPEGLLDLWEMIEVYKSGDSAHYPTSDGNFDPNRSVLGGIRS